MPSSRRLSMEKILNIKIAWNHIQSNTNFLFITSLKNNPRGNLALWHSPPMKLRRGLKGCNIYWVVKVLNTAQKIKFSIKHFFSKCDQIWSFLRIWSHLLKKSLREIFIFCAVSKKPVSQFAEKNVPSYYLVLQLTKRLVNLRMTYYSMQISWLVLVVTLTKL